MMMMKLIIFNKGFKYINIFIFICNFIFYDYYLFIYIYLKNIIFGDWGLGIGDWGLGIGPNPQSPIPIYIFFCNLFLFKKFLFN